MATHLKPGDPAPDFSGKDAAGNTHRLKDYRGRKLLLYFYPEDDTPACTAQACNLRDHYTGLLEAGYAVLGVSHNSGKDHAAFAGKYNLPFPLLADEDRTIIEAYGVWGEKNLYGRKYIGLHRTTFIINEEGLITRILLRPKTKAHAEEIMR